MFQGKLLDILTENDQIVLIAVYKDIYNYMYTKYTILSTQQPNIFFPEPLFQCYIISSYD